MHLTRHAAKRPEQRAESPVASHVMVLCLSCFFWRSNVSEMQYRNLRSRWECGRITPSLKNRMLRILRISVWPCLAWGTLGYSQDQKAKNVLSPVSWTMAQSSSESCCFTMVEMTDIGIAFWCFLAGPAFLNDLSSH